MDFEPLQPPRGYTSLASVVLSPYETLVNVIGVVVDYMPPAPTKGTDWSCTFFLQDSSLLGSHHNSNGVRVRMFRPSTNMPQSLSLGDIVVIRGLLWKDVSGNQCLVDSFKRADYLVFSPSSIPDDAFAAPHISEEGRVIAHTTLQGKKVDPPKAVEQEYIIKLREWAKKHSNYLPQPGQSAAVSTGPRQQHQLPPRPVANMGTAMHELPPRPSVGMSSGPLMAPRKTDKFAWLKDIQPGKFHDLAGEVLKIWESNHVVDVYISDYTFHPQLYEYKENTAEGEGREGDPYNYVDSAGPKRKWKGPWGKHTICIGVFDPHASYVRREIQEGDFVRVHNARCFVKDGGNLQARLHGDYKHPDQIDVAKLPYTNHLYKEINEAKEKYWQSRKPKNVGSRQEKKKNRRKERERLEKEKEKLKAQIAAREAKGGDDGDVEMGDEGLFVPEDPRDKLNPKVVSAHQDRDTLTLSKIIDTPYRTYTKHGQTYESPWTNQKVRSRLRVIDFYPPDLEDFARSLDDPEYNDVDARDQDSTISIDGDLTMRSDDRWEWAFVLLVEDARPTIVDGEKVTIPLVVHADDAVHLLGLEATDLRHNLQVKHRLEQKLWTLWGNLAELKADEVWAEEERLAPSNHPFECCIDEFGTLQEGGWQRSWKIRQTIIRD